MSKRDTGAADAAWLTDIQLENELRRRGCAVIVISPGDIREQWEVNQDADENPDPCPPTDAETEDALRQVQRLLDKTVHENEPAFEWGPMSDACVMISAKRREKGSSR
jgi:hypothetical protein